MDNTLKEIIKSDIYRHYGSGKLPLLWHIHNPSLYCTIVYRKAHYYMAKHKTRGGVFNWLLGLYSRTKLNRVARKYSFQIPYDVEIGPGFHFIHFGRLIMAPKVKIGSNCNILTGVTIGTTTRGAKAGIPTIGNNVWIGPNAVIVGKITIGDDVLIAGNAFVNFDVPSHSIVVGNPGKIIPCDYATKDYITLKYDLSEHQI